MIQDKYLRVPLHLIQIDRTNRQRKEINTDDLKPSIAARGVINPIIVEALEEDRGYLLIAGERRYTASLELGLSDIPARLSSDLNSIERQIIELEENIKRRDLTWQEETQAVATIHAAYATMEKDWNQVKTGEAIGISPAMISKYLAVAEELNNDNRQVKASTGIAAAYNLIARRTARSMDDAMNELLSDPEPIKPKAASANGRPPDFDSGNVGSTPAAAATPTGGDLILNRSFLEWAPEYNGRPFSFVHCDFPYGIGMDQSDQGNSEKWDTKYADSEDVYWELCGCFCQNLNRIVAPSAHVMFWFSMEFYRETLEFFEANAPSLVVQKFPLIWHKTDGRGIIPDANRQPRRVYETALIMTRGDRKIIRPIANTYGSPTTKEVHQSEKPEPMLKHFFQMFVDQDTRMLDPTAGSGTAIRAAESFHATTLGLEINLETVKAANILLRKSRTLRQANGN